MFITTSERDLTFYREGGMTTRYSTTDQLQEKALPWIPR